jgi:hypothetical protein
VKSENVKTGAGIILFLIIFISLFKSCFSDSSQKETVTLRSDQIETIEQMKSQGFITIEEDINRVYVAPLLWLQMDAKLKGDFSASLAVYCANKRNNNLYWVEIYDKQSGKKLAKYSQSWGFDVY